MAAAPQIKLLEQVRRACRARHFSRKTEVAYTGWVHRFILYHGKRHPATLEPCAIADYLTHLADDKQVSTSTQNQAASALLFLYREVLDLAVQAPRDVLRPPKPRRLPVVLTGAEVMAVLDQMTGTKRVIATLLYGSGLRLLEALRLRVKDVVFDRSELVVRAGKGGGDRVTMLPRLVQPELLRQIERVRAQHTRDRNRGGGWVDLPTALARKSPNAASDLAWQYCFPATRQHIDSVTGQTRRHHLQDRKSVV